MFVVSGVGYFSIRIVFIAWAACYVWPHSSFLSVNWLWSRYNASENILIETVAFHWLRRKRDIWNVNLRNRFNSKKKCFFWLSVEFYRSKGIQIVILDGVVVVVFFVIVSNLCLNCWKIDDALILPCQYQLPGAPMYKRSPSLNKRKIRLVQRKKFQIEPTANV